MTTIQDRTSSAVVVIDVQNGVVADAHQRDEVVAAIGVVVDRARTEGVPVVWVQHSDAELAEGSDAWQYVDALQRADDEPVVHKSYGDSFEDTDLESILAEHRVGHLVVTGAQTDACIRSTLHGALARGYDATLVADAHTTEDMREWGSPIGPDQAIAYTNLYWSFSNAPGRTGTTLPSAEISFSPAS